MTQTLDQVPLPQNAKSISRLSLLIAFLSCSVIAVWISIQFFPVFQPPMELRIPNPPDEIAVAREASYWNCRLGNAQLLITGILGAIASGLWAVIGTKHSQNKTKPVAAFFLAGMVASAICATGIFFGHLIMEYRVDPDYETQKSVAAQVTWMSFLGFGLGAALGIGQGTRRAVLQYGVNGLISGILAGIFYFIITSTLMSNSLTDVLVPGGTLTGNKDVAVLAVWFGVMGIVFSMIIPRSGSASLEKQIGH